MIRILNHVRIFELKNVSHFIKKARDQYFEEINECFEPTQNQFHMLARVIVSFDDLSSYLAIPPVPGRPTDFHINKKDLNVTHGF